MKFKANQTEKYYRRILSLNKIKPFIWISEKQYIFDKGYCWDLLFKDEDAPSLCFYYALFRNKPFPEGEKYIALKPDYSYQYAFLILKDRFELGEEIIFKECTWKDLYISYMEIIGKKDELRV